MQWSFELFGGVRIRRESVTIDTVDGGKSGALLALLALAPGRMRSREEVIDLLWPDTDLDEARNRFKQILLRLRRRLEPENTPPGSVLVATRTHVGLAPGLRSDVAEFERHLRLAAQEPSLEKRIQHTHAALSLYRGELASGVYLDVLLAERERLESLAQSARSRLDALSLATVEGERLSLPLPAPVRSSNRFFGRESEQSELTARLSDHRLVTVLGPGGAGKTRLVQELLPSFFHARFVALSAVRDGSVLLDAIVDALELPQETGDALLRLQRALADEPTLLVLDNFEQLVATGGAEQVARLLDALPMARILVTSRRILQLPEELVVALGPLPDADAVALFLDRARLARPAFPLDEASVATVAELVRRLDGLPLAVELAAARAGVVTPAQTLARLSRRFDLLADRRGDREARQTSLRATLDWSWELLSPDVQRFFARLSLFRGSFSLDAAEAVTGEPLALDYLQSLSEASLILTEAASDEIRFRLLESLREYALEKLEASEAEALSLAHADYFVARAVEWGPKSQGPDFHAIMKSFRQDHDNMLAALERLLVAHPMRAIPLCLNLSPYWQHAYWSRPALGYLYPLLEAAERQGAGGEQLAWLHHLIGAHHGLRRERGAAFTYQRKFFDYHRERLEEREAAGDDDAALLPLRSNLIGGLHNLGSLLYEDDRLDEAERHYREAIERCQIVGNDHWHALMLYGLFRIERMRGIDSDEGDERLAFFAKALRHAEEGTARCRRAQHDFDLCFFLYAQAYLLVLMGHEAEARPVLAEGLSLACRVEHWLVAHWLLLAYERRAVAEERWEEAAQLRGAAAGIVQRHPDVAPDEDDAHLFPAVDLPALLGQERYDALLETGRRASPDHWVALASPLFS